MNIESLRKNLSYDPATGEIRWIRSGKGRKLGAIAGTKSNRNLSSKIDVDGQQYAIARVAWALHYNEAPSHWVVFLNGDKSDLRACNLGIYEKNKTHHLIRKPARESVKKNTEWLKENCNYDPLTGSLSVLVCGDTHRPDCEVTCNGIKYRSINVPGGSILSHRLAWLLYYGDWPTGHVDHKDHDGTNNRIDNLRDVTHGENLKNARKSKANKSGVTGVYWNKFAKKWHASIGDNGTVRYLGLFRNLEDAAKARKDAEIELGFHENHGR